ncbi:MAG TPA: histidine phosphatase family protein [Sphingobium sp.]|nr:histidine phosphatase family protein [Sphingobium sp.]
MKTVIVLRHAKSDWGDMTLRDFDRGLNGRGERAAAVMGRWAARHKVAPERIIASPAVRVVETLHRFAQAHGACPEPQFDMRLYLASAPMIAEVLADTGDDSAMILIAGHSSGVEDFILAAVPNDSDSALRDAVTVKFPTAALAILDFDVPDWQSLAQHFPGRARLRAFVRPRDLDPALGPDQR